MDLTIAHISDMHAGSAHFLPDVMDKVIEEINADGPDVLIATGDFTSAGYLREYEVALGYLGRIRCERQILVPGNADSRNVGYKVFERMMGSRFRVVRIGEATILSVDSSEPDLDVGSVGREWYPWIEENFAIGKPRMRIFCMHHHLVPVPGTGRDPTLAYDAGDLLEVLIRSGVDLVLTGHRHIPWVWRLEDMYVVTAGTVSSRRLRGHTQPSYNVIRVAGDEVSVTRREPSEAERTVVRWSLSERARDRGPAGTAVGRSEPR